MTLNGVIADFAFFTEFDCFPGTNYVIVVEDRPAMFVKYCLPVPVPCSLPLLAIIIPTL